MDSLSSAKTGMVNCIGIVQVHIHGLKSRGSAVVRCFTAIRSSIPLCLCDIKSENEILAS